MMTREKLLQSLPQRPGSSILKSHTGWAPYGDANVANIDNASISFSADGTFVVKQNNGATTSATYTVDDPTNMINGTLRKLSATI
jgi:hypothetical protein